jgi:hypothetical protein
MADFIPLNPRALIRHAVVRVLKERAPVFGGRVWPDREEHWLAEEFPACGVYTLSEERLESDVSPDPLERRIDLVVECLALAAHGVDDGLDVLALEVERALSLERIGQAMGSIVNELREAAGLPPLEKKLRNGRLLWPVDTLLTLTLAGTDLGIAVDGSRQIGVAVLQFDLEYAAQAEDLPLPDFLQAVSGWDLFSSDGVVNMVSQVKFSPPPDAPGDGNLSDESEQIDDALGVEEE